MNLDGNELVFENHAWQLGSLSLTYVLSQSFSNRRNRKHSVVKGAQSIVAGRESTAQVQAGYGNGHGMMKFSLLELTLKLASTKLDLLNLELKQRQ